MAEQRILLRADGSSTLGGGHVLRCLALALALRDQGYTPVFACAELDPALEQRVREAGFDIFVLDARQDARHCAELVGRAAYAAVVVDHYGLNTAWEQQLRAVCALLVVVDDFSQRPHIADLVVDGNAGSAASYAGRLSPDATLLAGPAYALLRPEFARARALRGGPASGARSRVLVCFGSADEANETAKVLEGLAGYPGQLEVVIGGANPHRSALLRQVADMPNARALVDVQDMAECLRHADVAIGAAGVSSWERCALGVPSLVAILADNQRGVARELEQLGVAQVLGEYRALAPADYRRALDAADEQCLGQMAHRAWQVVDGGGPARVAAAMAARVAQAGKAG